MRLFSEKQCLTFLKSTFLNAGSRCSSLLEQTNERTFHVKNLQALITEIYKTIADLNPTFMKESLIRQDTPYNLKCNLRLKTPSVRTLSYGSESTSFRGSHLWNSLPLIYKDSESLHVFKSKIRQWNGSGCTCKLCK